MNANTPAGWSALSGSLLSIIVSFDPGELFASCVLAVAGTIVSYAVSRVLKAVFEKRPE